MKRHANCVCKRKHQEQAGSFMLAINKARKASLCFKLDLLCEGHDIRTKLGGDVCLQTQRVKLKGKSCSDANKETGGP